MPFLGLSPTDFLCVHFLYFFLIPCKISSETIPQLYILDIATSPKQQGVSHSSYINVESTVFQEINILASNPAIWGVIIFKLNPVQLANLFPSLLYIFLCKWCGFSTQRSMTARHHVLWFGYDTCQSYVLRDWLVASWQNFTSCLDHKSSSFTNGLIQWWLHVRRWVLFGGKRHWGWAALSFHMLPDLLLYLITVQEQ